MRRLLYLGSYWLRVHAARLRPISVLPSIRRCRSLGLMPVRWTAGSRWIPASDWRRSALVSRCGESTGYRWRSGLCSGSGLSSWTHLRQSRCIARYAGCSEDRDCLDGQYCEPQYYACMSRCGGERVCPEGTSCVASFNTCMPYCERPQDCPIGTTCVNEIEGGFCVPSGSRACGWGGTCPPGTVCDQDEGRCLEDQGACVERADCGEGGRCVGGRCLHEPSACGPAQSCPDHQMCRDDLCVSGGDALRSCDRDADCPDREVCHILIAACVPDPDNYPCEGIISVRAVLNALKMAVALPEPESAPKFDPASPVRFVMR